MSIGNWSLGHTPYNETEVKKVVPTNAGVYALWVYYKSGRWGCYYIGKAEDLESRLLDHLSKDEPNKCIKENGQYKRGFSWIEITTEAERSGAEKHLYNSLKPECNQNDPGGTPLKINLPSPPSS